MTSGVKRAAELVLCRGGIAALARRLRAGDSVILAYHNIVPEGERAVGDLSLHLPQRAFARQLALLERTHDVVPLTAALDAPRRAGRPRVVITFDDACQGAVVAGTAELRKLGMPATIFVAPGFIGGRSFWWDAVDEVGALSGRTRMQALGELQGRDARVRQWAVSEGVQLREVPWHQCAATEAQLRAAAGELIAFGSHSWSHPDLTALGAAELNEELTRPLTWLRDRLPGVLPWLAYPYGFASPAVAVAVREAGYEGALRVSGGYVRASVTDPFDVPRLNIPAGVSLHGFELRTSGLFDR